MMSTMSTLLRYDNMTGGTRFDVSPPLILPAANLNTGESGWEERHAPNSGRREAARPAERAREAGFIRDVLKPRFLPQVRPTEWNSVIDIHGAWAPGRYRFMQRYRSGMEHNRGEEFDAAFARIDRVGQYRFDVYSMRHTGRWWRLHAGLTLDEALHVLETTDEALLPV